MYLDLVPYIEVSTFRLYPWMEKDNNKGGIFKYRVIIGMNEVDNDKHPNSKFQFRLNLHFYVNNIKSCLVLRHDKQIKAHPIPHDIANNLQDSYCSR